MFVGIGVGIGRQRFASGGVAPYVGLLDDYPNAAAAYSLRLLKSDYTGDAIRVRRTNLDEMDIGFDALGNLDTSALLAFTGTGALDNGFITTWYDQSGNSINLIQTTALSQPRIVSGGVVDVVNGLPSLLADGVNDFLNASYITTNITTQFYIYDKVGTGGWLAGLKNAASLAPGLILQNTGVVAYQQGAGFTPEYSNNNQALVTLKSASVLGTDWAMWGNNVTIPNSGQNIGSTTPTSINLFRRGNGTQFANTYLQEYIVYDSDKTSDVNGINTNINDYYSIY
jgi:hypothetical protein